VITSNGQQTILIPYDKVDLFNSNLVKHDGPKLSWGTYEFVKGDTLSSVAKKFNINTQRLMEINGLKPYVPILEGQSILIPWTADGPSNLTETWQLPEFSQPSSLYGKEIIYKIKRGDTLSGISKRFGVSIKAVKTWNQIKGTMIREGKKLVIYKDFKIPRVSKMLER
jgi:membrane-bound lytic murein transglycosylase D